VFSLGTCSVSKSRATSAAGDQVADQLRAARWFGGKSRTIVETSVLDQGSWADGASLWLVEVSYESGPPDTYVLADRLDEPTIGAALLRQFSGAEVSTQAGGQLRFRPTRLFESYAARQTEPVTVLRGEQSNTSLRFGDSLILKLFRRLQYGPNPDVEVGWYLTEESEFHGTPGVAGSLEYIAPDGRAASLALLQAFEANRGDAWTTTLGRLRDVLAGGDPSASIDSLSRLGSTTAELHLALAAGSGDFAAQSITTHDLDDWRAAIRGEVDAAARALERHGVAVDTERLYERAEGIDALLGAEKIRHHGDYHLGQILERPDGSFVIIDFEGEPAKPLALRREKRSPLRDVAGLLRSLDYACHTALRSIDGAGAEQTQRAAAWLSSTRQAFLTTYLATMGRGRPGCLPLDVESPLAALELEKAAYEVLYELNNRPDWLPIPLAALQATR
jgi:trehalose synthase-fused probable maltokinase